jgi:hypothetical protein
MSNYFNYSATGTQVTAEAVTVADLTEVTLAHDNFFDLTMYSDEACTTEISSDNYTLGELNAIYDDETEETYNGYNKITLEAAIYMTYTTVYVTYKTYGDIVDASDMNSKVDVVDTAMENNFSSFDDSGSIKDSTKSASDFATASHNHDSVYYTETEIDAMLVNKSDTDHNHDSDYADISHTHDDRYYTETETNNLLDGKSDTTHNHNDTYYTETEVDGLLASKSDTTHNHDLDYADISHTHDDRYYTEDETDSLLSDKSDTTHNHDSDYADISHNHSGVYEPANANIQTHITDTENPHSVDKTDVGLGNVDNTSDANKPVSSATQSALDAKEDSLGNPDTDGKVLSSTAAGVRTWVSAGSGSGDMLQSTYDTDGDGTVNEADSAKALDDGAGNTATVADIVDAISKEHEHSNKVFLDGLDSSDLFDIHGLTADTTLLNGDEIPFWEDTSGADRKIRFDNFKTSLSLPESITDLDVNNTGIADGDAIEWNATAEEWQVTQYADATHNHNDTYYTEDEVDSALSGKSDTTHTHTIESLDVNTAAKADGKVLKWDNANSEWVYFDITTLIHDDLGSSSTDLALSANQGRALNEGKIDMITEPVNGNLVKQDSTGAVEDAGVAVNDTGTTTGDLWTGSKITSELSDKADKTNVLELDNTDAFTPDADYEPATKKYVDESIPTVPVDSVNTKTGAVVLDADDIDDSTTTNKFVTAAEKSAWDAKSDFDGAYSSLTGTPTIPDELSDLSEDATHRTVTDAEKSTWNGKQDALGYTAEDSSNKENSVIDTSTTKYPTVNLLKTGLDGKSDTTHDHSGVYEPADSDILKSGDNISELTNNSNYITSSGVTYEALNGNSDVGTGAAQVAAGDHNHSGTYEPVLDANQKRTITTGTATPDDGDGSNGDIYIKYTA